MSLFEFVLIHAYTVYFTALHDKPLINNYIQFEDCYF